MCLSRLFIDSFFYLRQWIATLITYLSIYLYGSEVSWEQTKNRKLDTSRHVDLNLDDAHDLDLLLNEAKLGLTASEARRNSTSNKCKALLTLSSVVLAASGLVLPKSPPDTTWLQALLLIGALLLLHVVIILAMHFAVGTEMQPSINQEDANLSEINLRKSLINNYLSCQTDQNNGVDFLVELYKVARFFFLLGLLILTVASVVSYSTYRDKKSQYDNLIEKLITDESFLEKVQEKSQQTRSTSPQTRNTQNQSSVTPSQQSISRSQQGSADQNYADSENNPNSLKPLKFNSKPLQKRSRIVF